MKKIISKISLIIVLSFFLFIGLSDTKAEGGIENKRLGVVLYENESKFSTKQSDSVQKMSNGHTSLGSINIGADFSQEAVFRNYKAYGVKGNVAFSYQYSGELLSTANKKQWHLRKASEGKIEDISLNSSVNKGALIILKSYDGVAFELAANPILNFFEDNPNGAKSFYTTSGQDIGQGVFFKIIVAYKSSYVRRTTIFGVDRYVDAYSVQESNFYIVEDSATASLHNLSVTSEDLEFEDYDIETFLAGETLEDGSVTTDGFQVDKLGVSNLVLVKHNDNDEVLVNDKETFTESGVYTVKVISKLGTEDVRKIYVFDKEDMGYNTYFGDNIIKGNRIFRTGELPSYAKNTFLEIKEVSKEIPILRGEVINVDNNEVVYATKNNRNKQTIPLTPGVYEAVFYSGNPDVTGSYYKYIFRFEILNESSKPYLNYYNLTNTSRLQDLESKHLEVAYQTTAGGYIYVCFSIDSYEEAFNYAYEIEKRFLEYVSEDSARYKSRENPNKKELYYDFIELTSVMNYYAALNVEANYFDPLDLFTYKTLEDELLEDLETLVLTESIKVFPSVEEKNKMIDRSNLYLNDFEFIQVGDYDVVSITAHCHKNNKTYDINFNEEVSNQLPLTSLYTITETNVYGDELVYDAYLIKDNTSILEAEVIYNGQTSTNTYSSSSVITNKIYVDADKFVINNIINNYDEWSIITFKAPNIYTFKLTLLISEVENIELYKKGIYTIVLIDRFGHSFEIEVDITGDVRFGNDTVNTVTYTEMYNKIYLNELELDEELIVDVADLKEAILRYVDRNKYTVLSFSNYEDSLNNAIDIYNNVQSTQEEIDAAYDDLNNHYNLLITSVDKIELYNALLEFEAINKSEYTSQSYNTYFDLYVVAKDAYLEYDLTSVELDDYINSLNYAKSNLIKRGDKGLLFDLLNQTYNMNLSIYTPSSVDYLNSTYLLSKSVFDNIDAVQYEIDMAYSKLDQAIKALIKRANFDELDAYLLMIQSLDESLYTGSSLDLLITAYDEALSISNERNALQVEVDDVLTQLTLKYDNLMLKGDDNELYEKIKELEDFKLYLLTAESIQLIQDVHFMASVLYYEGDIQDEYDNMVELINQTLDDTVEDENRVRLYNYITEIEKNDKVSKKQQEEYNKAYNLLMDLEATEEEVEAALVDLESAMDEDDMKLWTAAIVVAGVTIAVVSIVSSVIKRRRRVNENN